MKICLVSQEYPPETAKGGIGTQAFLKAHGLAQMGHEVYVVSRSVSGLRSEGKAGGVLVIRIAAPAERARMHTEIADWISYSSEVAAAVQALHGEVGLDLVEFPEWGCEGYVHLLNRTEWNRVPTVLQLHGPLVMFANTMGWPEKSSEFFRTGTMMEETCLRLADAVYSSSQCSVEWCARHYGSEATAIPIIHSGVDTAHFSPCDGARDDRPTVIFVGRIARNKGVFELLEASIALSREVPGLQLRVVGSGERKVVEELKAQAVAQGGEGLLDLAGFVSRENLPGQLCRAHVFAAPSIYEGGPGFVYLEAMSCGLPVIACTGSGAAEVVTPGQTGLLVPPNNPVALVAALRRLLADPREREAMGQRARQYVVQQADSEFCLKRLEAFYRRVVDLRAIIS